MECTTKLVGGSWTHVTVCTYCIVQGVCVLMTEAVKRCFLLLAGMFVVIPCTDSYTAVDLRTRPFDVTPQEVSVTLGE